MPRKSCSYPVVVVHKIFEGNEELAQMLRQITGAETPRILVIADNNVVQRVEGLGPRIGRYVQANQIELATNPLVIPGGEKIKFDNFDTVIRIVSGIVNAHLKKNDCIVAIGGGAVLDVVGYVAAQVRGGTPILRIPTTPAAMVDAAFASYAAVNCSPLKDGLRVPALPAGVAIATDMCPYVLDAVWSGGVGEIVRHAVACDATLFKKLEKDLELLAGHDQGSLQDIIALCVASRQKKGSSSLGLWSAMRLESMSNYKLPHGYAVPMGILIDFHYSALKGLVKLEDVARVENVLRKSYALDGLAHSLHLVTQHDHVLRGLEDWFMATGVHSIEIPAGIGKTCTEEEPDVALYKKAMKQLIVVPKKA